MALSSDIRKNAELFIRRVENTVDKVNEMVGESFVRDSRNAVTITIYDRLPDRQPWELTGNLRSGIGYSATKKKKLVAENFRIIEKGDVGPVKAKTLADELAEKIKDQALIMVSGMGYTLAVEARGYDVVTNSIAVAKTRYVKLMEGALKEVVK